MGVGVIILAAGKGTRMKSGLAKVLHEAAAETERDAQTHTRATHEENQEWGK